MTRTKEAAAQAPAVSAAASAPARGPRRIAAFDYVKGMLVLIMVLYHWLNHFIGPAGFGYRYLRFLPPSFIFITGFLISHVYFSKYKITDLRLPKRLAQRGVKLLALFTLLNLAILKFFPAGFGYSNSSLGRSPLDGLVFAYTTGSAAGIKAAAFSVLVPISYLLILSALLVVLARRHEFIMNAICLLAPAATVAASLCGVTIVNLELLTIGLLGILCGRASIDRVDKVTDHWVTLVCAYLAYTVAITFWEVIYPLQIVGVCLTVTLLYALGRKSGSTGIASRWIILLGNYSLFGYISQIAIVQLLHRTMGRFTPGTATLAFSFLAAFALTMLSVIALDRARAKARPVDWIYRTVFN